MRTLFLISAALAAAPALAAIGPLSPSTSSERVQSGTTSTGTKWSARSMMVGQTSTLAFPGDYAPSRPGKDGLVFLELDSGFCSGSLLKGGNAILTAAHCVADGNGQVVATSGRAWFWNGVGPVADPFYDLQPGPTAVNIGSIFVAPGYTGEVIDHNDLAIIFLNGAAPDFATEYLLAALADPTGIDFNVAGFGNRGTSGATGSSGGTFGKLREGDNKFEYALGNAAFGDGWAVELEEPLSQISDSWVSDFDRIGFAANDTSCLVTGGLFGTGTTFCDNAGVGLREVGVAGGDSGGPQFVNGKIVSVTSYGLTFGSGFGDFGGGLNSGWGEFSGYAPVFRNRDWIQSLVPLAFIPEPATWGLMIAGFGMVGAAARRRRSSDLARTTA